MKKNIIFSLAMVLLPIVSVAASGGHQGEVPYRTIFWQCVNLTILFGALTYFFRAKAIHFFKSRRETYMQEAQKSHQMRDAAEKSLEKIKHDLQKLDESYSESIARAEAEASELRSQMINEAKQNAIKIKEESEETIRIETQNAQRDIKHKFVSEAVGMARQVLSKDIASSDHHKLQSDFARNIQAVNP